MLYCTCEKVNHAAIAICPLPQFATKHSTGKITPPYLTINDRNGTHAWYMAKQNFICQLQACTPLSFFKNRLKIYFFYLRILGIWSGPYMATMQFLDGRGGGGNDRALFFKDGQFLIPAKALPGSRGTRYGSLWSEDD